MSLQQINKVALVGAGGQLGQYIVAELRKNKQFDVTALTRIGSTNVLPQDVRSIQVDYDNASSLIDALKGADVLVITLAAQAPKEQQNKLIDAAIAAGVRLVIPNTWGYDRTAAKYDEESLIGTQKKLELAYIREKGGDALSFIGVACGFWYEYSLSGGLPFFGIDVVNKHVRFLDDGQHSLSTSTWEQTGRAVAALLALPAEQLDALKNSFIRVQSFNLSQRQMLDAVQRVTQTTDADFTIEHRPARENWQEGVTLLKTKGDMSGFAQALYSTAFFDDIQNDYAKSGTLNNEQLGLPNEDLLEYTTKAIEMQKENYMGKLFASRFGGEKK